LATPNYGFEKRQKEQAKKKKKEEKLRAKAERKSGDPIAGDGNDDALQMANQSPADQAGAGAPTGDAR